MMLYDELYILRKKTFACFVFFSTLLLSFGSCLHPSIILVKTVPELQPDMHVFTKWEEHEVAVENLSRCREKLLLMQTTDMNQSLRRKVKLMLAKDAQQREKTSSNYTI